MSRSSNRYVPISMPLPIGLPRAYYYAEENIPDFDENELESYNQWMESIPPPNNEREQNCPGPQNNGAGPQWLNKNQASPTAADPSHRERHHIQMHEANPSADITELFRRKQEDRYGVTQEIIMTDDSSPRYFYRPTTVSRLGAQRVGLMDRDRSVVSAPPLPSGPLLPHHIGYYQHNEHVGPPHHAYETLVFHSNPQLHRNNLVQKGNLHCTAQLAGENPNIITNVIRPSSKSPPHMKPAVTVRTPRYFRRSGVFKRPSALCLPLSCELDPAVLQQRPMKTRLPSTMPAMQILSPTHRTHPQMRQMTAQDDDTSNTSRSAPPPYFEFLNDVDRNNAPGKPGKLDQSEIERIQQIIEQRTGVKDNQEETTCEDDIVSNNDESKQTEMEYLLNQYQQMVDNRQQPEPKIKPTKGSTKSRKIKTTPNSKVNVGQMLKPKIPPSLKQKRASKHNVKQEEKCQKEKDKIEIERITSSVLDTLLHDLQASGIINDDTKSDMVTSESIQKIERPTTAKSAKNSRNSPRNANNEPNRRGIENDIETAVSTKSPQIHNLHKNYNYTQVTSSANNTQDSTMSSNSHMDTNQTSTSEDTEKFSKESSSTQYMTQEAMNKNSQGCEQGGQEGDTLKNNIHNVTRNLNCFYNMQDDKEQNTSKYDSNSNTPPQQWPPQKRTLKYPHDDHTAMELHRSKSYIVNLIDRALSRELGTIPEERTSKQYMNLEARTALDLMSSPAVKNMDNDMCLEITQVLADSISTAPVKDAMPCSSTCSTPKPNCSRGDPNKMTDDLVYHPSNDEPMYIKQLKKLRWGHLKHIQREMRRLEDLEKFLDSCSSEK